MRRRTRRASQVLTLSLGLMVGLAACVTPPPLPTLPASTAAEPDASDPTVAPDASDPDPADPRHEEPLYCGDAFVLSQVALSGWTWAGDDAAQLEAAQPEAAFHPNEVLEGLEPVCTTTFRMPVDGPAGVSAYAIAIVAGQGGDAAVALEQLREWAAAHGYLPQGEGDYIEHVRMGADGMIAAKLMFRVIGDAVSVTDELALELTDAGPEDVIVTHIDFGLA